MPYQSLCFFRVFSLSPIVKDVLNDQYSYNDSSSGIAFILLYIKVVYINPYLKYEI